MSLQYWYLHVKNQHLQQLVHTAYVWQKSRVMCDGHQNAEGFGIPIFQEQFR